MSQPNRHSVRVGASRPNQLLHTFGVGAVADMPNLSVITLGLDFWDYSGARGGYRVEEQRLLAALRLRLGSQVSELRLPPYLPEDSSGQLGDWTRVGVPVGLFPSWLRCSDNRCNQLAPVQAGFFELLGNPYAPESARYVHSCRGEGNRRPPAVPARFVLACEDGHLDDFCWSYFVHGGNDPGRGHPLKLEERGTTGEASDVFVVCTTCSRPDRETSRPMAQAFGPRSRDWLPACRGRHPHLDTFEPCGKPTRTLVLGATNSWFPMKLGTITVPRDYDPVAHLVAEYWEQLKVFASLDESQAARILPGMAFWAEFDRFTVEQVWAEIQHRAKSDQDESEEFPADDLLTPEWQALTSRFEAKLPDFTTRHERPPRKPGSRWLDQVVLVPRLREVAALYGFTRIDAPPWDVIELEDDRRAPLVEGDQPAWVPCAESRGEGVFLRFAEDKLAEWEQHPSVLGRARQLAGAHRAWRSARGLPPEPWPGARYVLLHSFAHALIREFALESGYGAAGIRERIYAKDGMAGLLLYTAAPDSEGTLGGLVSLGRWDRLEPLIERAVAAARLCTSDPLCAEHNPAEQARLYGAACHACLFAAETTCERGNHFLDRTLLVNTLAGKECGFFAD